MAGSVDQGKLEIRLLGELTVRRGGRAVELPPSRKTRALLAYLALSDRPRRREALCDLLWDVTDDPRAALRWSLSRLRPLVDDEGCPRLVADRSFVCFEANGADIDVRRLREALAGGPAALELEELEALARSFRGEFLEGLELTEFRDFQAWCTAEREEARRLEEAVMAELCRRFEAEPERALPWRRRHAQVAPFDEAAHAALVATLADTDRRREAELHAASARRVLAESGQTSCTLLEEALARVRGGCIAVAAPTRSVPGDGAEPANNPAVVATEVAATRSAPAPSSASPRTPLVGRLPALGRLDAAMQAARGGALRMVVVRGEAGIGKSALLDEWIRAAAASGAITLAGRAWEPELCRPFGPWAEAFAGRELAAVAGPLREELSVLLVGGDAVRDQQSAEAGRGRLFRAVVDVLAALTARAGCVVLAFDDFHSCDAASIELLHYVLRMARHRPLLVVAALRDGELFDNPPAQRLLRALRRDTDVEDLALQPLEAGDVARLVEALAPGLDPVQVHAQSRGNPLFVVELARAGGSDGEAVPDSIRDLLRDRVDRLEAPAAETLRWAAVFGASTRVGLLASVLRSPAVEVVESLESLERKGFLVLVETAAPGGPQGAIQDASRWEFRTDLLRRSIYSSISSARRRLMHAEAARLLDTDWLRDDAAAAELAHHAALAGEAGLAARACLTAARRCLRVFGNADAARLVRRGLKHARDLSDPERVCLEIELSDVALTASRPRDLAAEAVRIHECAERALDHGALEQARLGFHMVSYLRWQGGDWSDARRQSLRAEAVARSADEGQRLTAMAEAARCLTLLEKDLPRARSLALEADALVRRGRQEPAALADAMGMLRFHEGLLDEAVALFDRASVAARRDGHRVDEFYVLEHRLQVEVERGDWEAVREIADEAVALAARLRDGSEQPFARAVRTLVDLVLGSEVTALATMEAALAAMRRADSKQRLAWVLARVALVELERGAAGRALDHAEEALRAASAVARPSEVALAAAIVIRAADELGRTRTRDEARECLHGASKTRLAEPVRQRVEALVGRSVEAEAVPSAGV